MGKLRLTHNRFMPKPATVTLPKSVIDCKKDGWKQFLDANGTRRFKNQGDCVFFVEAQSHSHDHDHDHGHGDDDHSHGHH